MKSAPQIFLALKNGKRNKRGRTVLFVGRRRDHRSGFLKIREKIAGRSRTIIMSLEMCADVIAEALRLAP